MSAYTGGAATKTTTALNAEACASGDTVAFRGDPDLHTAAHEAAHVVQQRGGISLLDGVGQQGDRHEQQADHVADLVVAGMSAEAALGPVSGRAAPAGQALQFKKQGTTAPKAKKATQPPILDLVKRAEEIIANAFSGLFTAAEAQGFLKRISSKRGTKTEGSSGAKKGLPFFRYEKQSGIVGGRNVDTSLWHTKKGANLPTVPDRAKGGGWRQEPDGGVVVKPTSDQNQLLHNMVHECVHLAMSGNFMMFLRRLSQQRGHKLEGTFSSINEGICDSLTAHAMKAAGLPPGSSGYNRGPAQEMIMDLGLQAVARLYFRNDDGPFTEAAQDRYGSVTEALQAWFTYNWRQTPAEKKALARRKAALDARYRKLGLKIKPKKDSTESIDAWSRRHGWFTVTDRRAILRDGGFQRRKESPHKVPHGTRVKVSLLDPSNKYGFIESPVAYAGWTTMSNLTAEK